MGGTGGVAADEVTTCQRYGSLDDTTSLALPLLPATSSPLGRSLWSMRTRDASGLRPLPVWRLQARGGRVRHVCQQNGAYGTLLQRGLWLLKPCQPLKPCTAHTNGACCPRTHPHTSLHALSPHCPAPSRTPPPPRAHLSTRPMATSKGTSTNQASSSTASSSSRHHGSCVAHATTRHAARLRAAPLEPYPQSVA